MTDQITPATKRGPRPRDPIQRFWSKIDKNGDNGCWLWIGSFGGDPIDGKRYGYLWDGRKHQRAHRISWELNNGPIPKGMFVCHRCDNPPCVNPAHLFIADNKSNLADMTAKGRRVSVPTPGVKNYFAKLTEDQVKEIRASSMRPFALAKAYGISYQNVWSIKARKRWKTL